MNCTQVERLIPLHVGNDLPTEQAAVVNAHLTHCALCQALAAEFAASRAWLDAFSTPVFDEAVFDEMRVTVRREIRRAEPQAELLAALAAWWRPRYAVAMAGLLLLAGLSFYVYRQRSAPTIKAPLADIGATAKQSLPATGGADNNESATKPAVAVRQSSRRRVVRRANLANPPQMAALPVPDLAATINDDAPALDSTANESTAPEMLHIELQTADPLIRIIWLAPKAEPIAPHTK